MQSRSGHKARTRRKEGHGRSRLQRGIAYSNAPSHWPGWCAITSLQRSHVHSTITSFNTHARTPQLPVRFSPTTQEWERELIRSAGQRPQIGELLQALTPLQPSNQQATYSSQARLHTFTARLAAAAENLNTPCHPVCTRFLPQETGRMQYQYPHPITALTTPARRAAPPAPGPWYRNHPSQHRHYLHPLHRRRNPWTSPAHLSTPHRNWGALQLAPFCRSAVTRHPRATYRLPASLLSRPTAAATCPAAAGVSASASTPSDLLPTTCRASSSASTHASALSAPSATSHTQQHGGAHSTEHSCSTSSACSCCCCCCWYLWYPSSCSR